MRDPRYDILFEPVRIGPVTVRNRFFQVPRCSGMGYRDPSAQVAMRGVKAEGGWAVVCTEQVEIHPASDITPFIELRIWGDADLRRWHADAVRRSLAAGTTWSTSTRRTAWAGCTLPVQQLQRPRRRVQGEEPQERNGPGC